MDDFLIVFVNVLIALIFIMLWSAMCYYFGAQYGLPF